MADSLKYKVLLNIFLTILLCMPAGAVVLDRVVAYIDDEAITLSELESAYADTMKVKPDISRHEVLQTIINRYLLLKNARRLRMQAADEAALLKEYIDFKVKAFIKIPYLQVYEFYRENRSEFGDNEFSAVREEIVAYLREKEVNRRLKVHIEKLREKIHIRVLLEN